MKKIKTILSVLFLVVLFSGLFLFFCMAVGLSVEDSLKIWLAMFVLYVVISLATLGIYAFTRRFQKDEEGEEDD